MVHLGSLLPLLLYATGSAASTGCGDRSCRAPPVAELPLTDKLLAASPDAEAEQVHLIGGGPDKVGIVWASDFDRFAGEPGKVEYCRWSGTGKPVCDAAAVTVSQSSLPRAYEALNVGKFTTCTEANASFFQECYYSSPLLHVARLEGLQPGTAYAYRISSEKTWRSFSTSAVVGAPITFAVVADLGQTNYSADTMKHMLEDLESGSFSSAIFPGDLSYADGFGPRWDSYGRLAEPLFSRLPAAYTVGNHEVDHGADTLHFTRRYPALFLSEDAGSPSDLYYSFEAGLAHVVMLCSYCASGESSAQYRWLRRDLARVDRSRTPWLVLSWHTPWYTSNAHHGMWEGNEMRGAMEDLLNQARADIVFTGHVHAYERTLPIYKNQTNHCNGTVYIVVGDGGNREGFATPWVTPETPFPPLYDQPEWSAFREFAFGYGQLRIFNSSRAQWTWYRNDFGNKSSADSVDLYPVGERPECQPVVV
jgi:hypothetical protein